MLGFFLFVRLHIKFNAWIYEATLGQNQCVCIYTYIILLINLVYVRLFAWDGHEIEGTYKVIIAINFKNLSR